MINVVLLLVFQCPDAQFWYMNTACYSTDELLYQNRCQKITSKLNTDHPQCHWLPATPFQTVQNPEKQLSSLVLYQNKATYGRGKSDN